MTNTNEVLTYAELRETFNKSDIGVLKICRRLSWAGHMWRAEYRIVHDSS